MEENMLSGANWICVGDKGSNTLSVECYAISCEYDIKKGHTARIAVAARNKDNYLLVEADALSDKVRVYEVCDNAWTTGIPSRTMLYEKDASVGYGGRICAAVRRNGITLTLDGNTVIDGGVLPKESPIEPRKHTMMLFGFDGRGGCVEYGNIVVRNDDEGVEYCDAAELFGCGDGDTVTADDTFELANIVPALNVRKAFEVHDDIKKATLYASARGFFESYINGRRVGQDRYAPGFTDYRLRIDYWKYDVTDMIRCGENRIRADVGAGYYNGYAGYNRHANVYGKEVSYIAKLVLEYKDGRCDEIVTDTTWGTTKCGAILYADYLQGEYYDARKADAEYGGRKCSIAEPPAKPVPTNGKIDGLKFEMTEGNYPFARKTAELDGEYVGEFPSGHKMYNFGRNMVGTVRVTMRGRRGKSIKIRYCERCRKDGSAYVANLRSAANTDVYTFSGEGTEVFEPSLTEHGFQYAEITGCGNSLDGIEILDVKGIVVSNISETTGNFECSNPLLNRLYENIVWGQRGNYLLILTDCPQRNERMGWTGDAQVFARTAAYNMNVLEFTRKWLRDLREAQLMYNLGGAVPDTAPLCGDNRPTGGCGGWGDAAVIVPWEMYRAYGDVSVLEECYPMMRAWIEYITSDERRNYGERFVNGSPAEFDKADEPYIQIQQSRGDHLTFDPSTPFIMCATAYSAYVTERMAEIAEILGKPDDAKKYAELYRRIKSAFRSAWVNADETIAYWGEMSRADTAEIYYSDEAESAHRPSQTAYALAIDFGLIDCENPRVRECFARTIDDFGGKPSVGFLGISHLIPALVKCGLKDKAFEIMEQRENPGWLYSVINGATTVWERWNSYIAETGEFGDVTMNSFNHYSYGAVGETFFETILGIEPAEAGYAKIRIRPTYGGTLTYARGYHVTPHGRIDCSWRRDDGTFYLECSLPEGIDTEIEMPDGSTLNVCGGRHSLSCKAR